MKNFLLILFVVLSFCQAFGQELLFKEFEMNSSLPAEECYSIIQDRKGYMWIATEEGFCRYSRGKMEVFNKNKGLPEKSVYASVIDQNGKLWIGTSKLRYMYFDGKVFKEAPFQKNYARAAKTQRASMVAYPFIIRPRNNSEFYLQSFYISSRVNLKTNEVAILPEAQVNTALYLREKGLPLICLNWNLPFSTHMGTVPLKNIIIRERNKKDMVLAVNLPHVPIDDHFSHTVDAGGYSFLSIDKNLIRIKGDGTFVNHIFPSRILTVKKDKNGGVWVGLYRGGIHYFPNPGNLNNIITGLQKYSVTGFCEDNEKGIWCTTLERGVFYCLNKQITGFTNEAGLDVKGTLLETRRGKMFFSSAGNYIFIFDGITMEKHSVSISEYTTYKDILPKENGYYLATTDYCRITDRNFNIKGRLVSSENRKFGVTVYQFAENASSNFIIAYGGISQFDKESHIYTVFHRFSEGPGKCIISLNDDEVLAGGKIFLKVLNVKNRKETVIPSIESEVTSILKLRSGIILLTTRDNGLYKYDHKTKRVSSFIKLPTDVLYQIKEDHSGNLWIASNKGIIKLTPAGSSYRCENYSIKHGLPSNTVNKMAILGNTLYFTTNEGLFCIPIDGEFIDGFHPQVYLNNLFIDGTKRNLKSHKLNLDYSQNNLKFEFDIPSYKPGVKVKYILTDESGDISQMIDGRELILPNLSPGRYKLVVRILNNDGYDNKYPWKLYIVIKPPFWKTGWFLISMILLTVGLIIFGAVLIVKRIKRQEENKTKTSQLLAEYQMSALQAQMNPHFVFNAINTIQGYILGQNKDEAYNYLTQFSKLIRMVLHHSQEKSVLLEDELEMLRLYIELEQLRFDHCFDFVLDIDPDVEIHEAYIPSMVIQPFIENAIWHGIINLKKSRQGLLTLKLSQTEELLLISIEDNGVGRVQASNYKTTSHKSVALSVTSQRIEMLNKQFGYKEKGLMISDVYDEAGHSSGTKVEIQLPLQFNK